MDIAALLKIAAREALEKSVDVSSSQLASDLGCSQQTAARRLKALEEEGLIAREVLPRGQTIRITSKGKEVLSGIYSDLSSVFGQEPATFSICGVVTSGVGDGKYYMDMEEYKKQFQEKLGFEPFPGTLNMKLRGEDLKARQELLKLAGINIEGFKKDGRTFGSVKCFRADVEGVEGAVVMPSRTHHSADTLEVISPEKIRDKLEAGDGDRLCVRIRIG
jgi:riboflavin kinase